MNKLKSVELDREETIRKAFAMANSYYQSGHIKLAENVYNKILEIDPEHPDALHMAGVMARQNGKYDLAANFIKSAIRIAPEKAAYHISFGSVLLNLKRRDEAVSSYKNALALNLDNADLLNNLGNRFKSLGEPDMAASCYRNAVKIKPDYAEVYYNLGLLLAEQGKPEEAVSNFHAALEIKPDFADVYIGIGNVLNSQSMLKEAVLWFQKGINHQPNNVAAYNNMGSALHNQDQLDEAIACYGKALEIDPKKAATLNNMGLVLQDQGKLKEAGEYFRRALKIDPNLVRAYSNFLLSLLYDSEYDLDYIFGEHKKWNDFYGRPSMRRSAPFMNSPKQDRRLRIGYVSPDFRDHSCAWFIEPLLEFHNRDKVEVFCYGEIRNEDNVTARIKKLSNSWYCTKGISDMEVVKRILSDGIDILVDLAGHTKGNRLPVFARKPAPVQITWLGYNFTTGLEAIDYRLSDNWLTPLEGRERFSERLYNLPRCSLAYRPPEKTPEPVEPAFESNGHITFGSFNSLSKVSSRTIFLWARVLNETPGSKLVLKARQSRDLGSKERILRVLGEQRVSPDRVIFKRYASSTFEHLAHYHEIDLALDTFPYNGTTTTCEALWMGVPVVTLSENHTVSRWGLSLLAAVGLEELAAKSEDEYCKIIKGLVYSHRRLKVLKTGMRDRLLSSPLCDAKGFADVVEEAFRTMWKRWCNKQRLGT
jgi:protein O-GlcNAc transferase